MTPAHRALIESLAGTALTLGCLRFVMHLIAFGHPPARPAMPRTIAGGLAFTAIVAGCLAVALGELVVGSTVAAAAVFWLACESSRPMSDRPTDSL